MLVKYQYDIAFSVAEEDLDVARKIAHALKARNIRYYLYAEHNVENLGKTLMQISQEVYGKKARHVLMLTSKVFVTKYWTVIESQIVHITAQKRPEFIFRVKLDDARVDSINDYLFSLTWNNNPDEIADVITKKIRSRISLWKRKISRIAITALFALFILLFTFYASRKDVIPLMGTLPENRKDSDSVQEGKREIVNDNEMATSASKKESSKFVAEVPGRNIDKIEIGSATFLMGSNSTRPQDSPAHTVSIKSFYISKTEISLRAYTIFAEATNRPIPPQPTHLQNNDYPVVNITWEDARAFCKWVGGRLPTEAEWEYAAGGGQSLKYSGGNNASLVAVYGKTNSCKLASKHANMFGLFDMTGNVAEWCADWYSDYPTSEQTNPQGPMSGSKRVVRGGHYASHVKPDPEGNQLRNTYRYSEMPDARKPYIGFRVVWDK